MPMPAPQRYRSITRTARFESELAAIEPDVRRSDEFLDGVEWVLCRRPEEGARVAPNSRIWYFTTNVSARGLELVLFYSFDDDRVTWLSLLNTEIPF